MMNSAMNTAPIPAVPVRPTLLRGRIGDDQIPAGVPLARPSASGPLRAGSREAFSLVLNGPVPEGEPLTARIDYTVVKGGRLVDPGEVLHKLVHELRFKPGTQAQSFDLTTRSGGEESLVVMQASLDQNPDAPPAKLAQKVAPSGGHGGLWLLLLAAGAAAALLLGQNEGSQGGSQ